MNDNQSILVILFVVAVILLWGVFIWSLARRCTKREICYRCGLFHSRRNMMRVYQEFDGTDGHVCKPCYRKLIKDGVKIGVFRS